MNNPYDWSKNEYDAYNALEQARSGIDTDIILKNLGHYDQAVVDAAATTRKPKDCKPKRRKTAKKPTVQKVAKRKRK